MPRYKGSCGCYNRVDAEKYGLVAAIVLDDIADKYDYYEREKELVDGYFYLSQTNRADALCLPRKSYGAALTKLEEKKVIKKKIGYKPGTTIKATWVKLLKTDEKTDEETSAPQDELSTAFSLGENDQSTLGENDQSIYNETKDDTNYEKVTVASTFPRLKSKFKKAGFPVLNSNQLKEKLQTLLDTLGEDETLTLGMILDAADNYINGNWEDKSIQKFLSPRVFPYCVVKKDNQSDEKENVWS